jgi:hypothetical protein
MSQQLSWMYKGKPVLIINDLANILDSVVPGTPVQPFGFVYKITNLQTGKFYIGKKNLFSNLKVALSQKELSTDKRRKSYKTVCKESNWKNYYGSAAALIEDVKKQGKEQFSREILQICLTKKQLTFFEIYYQFKYGVLFYESYNDNILGKFYRRDLMLKPGI